MIIIWFLFLLLFQILHIFEEISMEAYKVSKLDNLNKYLIVASVIVIVTISTLVGIVLDTQIGYILGVGVSLLALSNCIVHSVGLIRLKKMRVTIAAGFYTGIPLGILGVLCFIQVVLKLTL